MVSSAHIKIAAVVPCYRVSASVQNVVRELLAFVDSIYVVDDKCPEMTGELVRRLFDEPSVYVIFNEQNLGVGGAVLSGYKQALCDGADIIVKIDGDGQMQASFIPDLIRPILNGWADYTKGNRFYNIEDLEEMPKLRLFGNAVLSFVSKVSSGYWDVMDPTNGFTAIHRTALSQLPLDKISTRYFFESDMLFRLYLESAVVMDVPMRARYRGEVSSLNIQRVALEFPGKYAKNFFKRFFYCYILRDFSAGSVEGLLGVLLSVFGFSYGAINWLSHALRDELTPVGTIMIAALCIILGVQFLLAALAFDISRVPKRPLLASGPFGGALRI